MCVLNLRRLTFYILYVYPHSHLTEPKRFTVAEGQLANIGTMAIPTLFRLGAGLAVAGYQVSLKDDDGKYGVLKAAGKKVSETSAIIPTLARPEKPLVLYQFHACPFCKVVREALVYLDLDAEIRPCPKGGKIFRPEAIAKGGKQQFPYLEDPNTGVAMYESAEIIKYLFKTYGNNMEVPFALRSGPFIMLAAAVTLLARQGKGAAYTRSKVTADTQPIEV